MRKDSQENIAARRFAEAERRAGEEGSSRAAKAAHRQPATRSEAARLREYTRIERGQTA